MAIRKSARSVTIKDIASALNMSHSTVSRALNDHSHIRSETKDRVREAAARLGYVANLPARLIRGDAGMLVGLVIPDVQNDFYSSISKALAERCRMTGRRLLLAITEDDPATEHNEIRALLEARVSGIVATLTGKPEAGTLALLQSTQSIQLVRKIAKLRTTAVCMHDAQGCREAVEHLISLGHRRIAYIGTIRSVSTGEDRLRGFVAAHAAADLVVDSELVALVPPRRLFGYDGVSRILDRPDPPTALMIGSSALTIGGLGAIRQAGLSIPGDISVIGYGDPVWFDLLSPPLSALSLPVEQLADAAAESLFAQINAEQENQEPPSLSTKRVSPTLILRGSTAPPRQL